MENREIEFRAWNKDKKKWIYEDFLISENGLNIYTGYTCDRLNAEISQYTGLKDKNGKKVFEGDILTFRTRNLEAKQYLAKVTYEIPMCAFSFNAKREDETIYHEWLMDSQWDNKTLEIIGNIYENPELLEVK